MLMHRFHYFALSLSLCQREENRLRSSKKNSFENAFRSEPLHVFLLLSTKQNRINADLVSRTRISTCLAYWCRRIVGNVHRCCTAENIHTYSTMLYSAHTIDTSWISAVTHSK